MAAMLNLRRDLPKVRKQFTKVLAAQKIGMCEYTAPCVIGAMINPRRRYECEHPAGVNDTDIKTLLREGIVKAPKDQTLDLISLQRAFDSGSHKVFVAALERVERKYLAASVDTLPKGQDAQQDLAGTEGSAVGEAETPNT